jgi:hypothetical protein
MDIQSRHIEIVKLTNQLLLMIRGLLNDVEGIVPGDTKALRAELQDVRDQLAASQSLNRKLREKVTQSDERVEMRPEDAMRRRSA